MADTGSGDEAWDVSGDSGAGSDGGRGAGGGAADPTSPSHFVNRNREEGEDRSRLPDYQHPAALWKMLLSSSRSHSRSNSRSGQGQGQVMVR